TSTLSSPPTSGLTTQDITTCQTLGQLMAAVPASTRPKPITAPTMLWVVETGQPHLLARLSQIAAASSAAVIPIANSTGSAATTSWSTMPLRMVSVTWPPTKNAPANSNTAARPTAAPMVSALLPTEVPKALATSFAPMFQAMYAPKMIDRM